MKKQLSLLFAVVGCTSLMATSAVAQEEVSVSTEIQNEEVVSTEALALDDTFELDSFVEKRGSWNGMRQGRGGPQQGRQQMRRPARQVPAFCKKLNLNEGQKDQIKSALLQHKKDVITLKANLKLAKLEYTALINDRNADPAVAETAGGKVVAGVTALAAAKTALETNIFFKILSNDQRPNAYKCFKMMKRHHKGERHHRGGQHHDRPGQRGQGRH